MGRARFKAAIAIILLALIAPALAGAVEGEGVDERLYKYFQGFVSAETTTGIVVNETRNVYVGSETKVYNSEGKPVEAKRLKGHKWVYIEGLLQSDGSVQATKIYLMPGHVEKKDVKKYPFMLSY
jgi:hypothetical protein